MSRNAPSRRSAHNRFIRNRRQDSLRFRLLRHEQLEDRRLLTAVAPPAGLVSWWTGDNTSADVTERNDPELVAGTGYTAGMVGQAFDFDGVNDRVQLVDSDSLKLTESMTIEGWINVRSVPSANNGQIIFRGDDRGGLDPYALYASQAGEIGFHIGALTGAAGLTAPIPWNRFVHVAATLDDATGSMRLYVDGTLAKEGVTEVRPFRDLDPASNPSIGIGNHGGYPTSPHNFPFDGLIDELAIYNRALEPDEIYAIFDAGSDGKGQMWVVDSTPGWGDVVDTPPTSFDVEFSHAYTYTNVTDVAAAFQVNGITADAFERKDADTATFSFISSPVADQSIEQTMHMEAGPVTRASDGLGMAEFDATFRFDVDRMQVASTDPPEGSTFSVPLNTVASASTAILSSAGMDGGNGGWPILYGANAVSSERIQLAIDEDQLLDSERSHTTEQVAFVVFDDDSTSAAPSYLQTGLITGVSSAPDQWTTVNLELDHDNDHDYTSMVVVATPQYDDGPPLVTRVRNAVGNHFDVKLQRTDGLTEEVFADVHFVVVEEGVYDDMEAARIDAPNPNDATDTGDPDFISRTDRAGDGGIYWVGESRSYANTYASPVVLGQVMSCYDSRFSTFWARGPSRWDPPSNSALFVGKHIAEDPDLGDTAEDSSTWRTDETIGYIVLEGGRGTIDGKGYLAGVGTDTVQGFDTNPPHEYSLSFTTLQVNFDEPFDPASVGVDDLVLSQGTVMAAQVLDIDSVVYTLTDIVTEGTLAVEIPAGSISDEFGNPIEAQALSYDVDWTTDYPFPTPLAPISPAGSLIHESSHAAFVSFPGDSDSYTIHVDPNQTMTVIIDPEENLRAEITLSDGEQNWTAESDGAGKDAVLQTIARDTLTTYTVTVRGSENSVGSYSLDVVLNAAVELESHDGTSNDTLEEAQNVDSSFVALGLAAKRGAVLGSAEETLPVVHDPYESGNVSVSIKNRNATNSTVTIPDSYSISDLDVVLDITHTRSPDLDIYLISPNGTRVELMTDVGSFNSENFTGTILDDEADIAITEGVAPFTGRHRPEGMLRDFDGEDIHGTWTLEITDDTASQSGTLNAWSLVATEVSTEDDFYKFQLAANTTVTLAATTLSDGIVDLQLVDSDGEEKASGTVGPTNVNKVVEQQLVAGTYFVRISTNTDYSLLMLLSATFDAEDNDEFASAQDIAPATTVIGHIGSEYTTTSRALNLRDALAEAELLGGHLVTISDQAEQDLINELFPSGLYWMGITDEGHEGQWDWMTGEPVTYTNWGSGEPNNAGGDEHFAFTAVTGWNDVDEFEIHSGIIEMPDRDFYRVTLAADEALVLETLTPADTSGEFFNRFDPMIRVYNESLALVAQDDNSATDGRNAKMTFFGTPDTYFVEVSATPKAGTQLTGQYVLTAQSKAVESPTPTLQVDTLADTISEFGGSTTATVTRITDDLSSSLTVTLSAGDTDEVTVPAEVTIPAGRTFISFAIDGKDDDLLDGTKEVIITADAAGFVKGVDSLAIDDHETIKLTIAADSISENEGTTTATVTRSNTDVSDDLIVRLSSSDTSEVTVPITVIISGGSQTSEPFAIAGKDDALLDGDLPVTIFAAAPGYVAGSDQLTVTDDDIPALTMTIDPTSVSEAAGTAAAIGTVWRNDIDLSTAVTVTLSSSDEDEATVPSSITIPINYASVTFFIDAVDDTIVDGTQTVTISAGATDYVDGIGILTVTDDEVFTPTLTVTIDPTSVSEAIGTAAATGTVWRNDLDLSTPVTVTLTCSEQGEATIPTSVTIAANEASATFPIDTVDDAIVDGTQTVTITASATDYVYGSADLYVTDDDGAATTVHVGDLDGRARLINKNKWAADVTVLVVDDGGLPVQNATVQGRWSTGIDGSAITDSEGLVTVTTGTISRSVDRAMFTVVGITHTSLNYVPGLNTDPDFPLDSTGTAIVVFQNGTVIPPAPESLLAMPPVNSIVTTESLTQGLAEIAAAEAMTLWSWQAESIPQFNVQIADLPTGTLGWAFGNTITLDVNANGVGWYTDLNTPVASQFDLLTVVSHEIGHLLGYGHSDHQADLMANTLPVGTRRLPGIAQVTTHASLDSYTALPLLLTETSLNTEHSELADDTLRANEPEGEIDNVLLPLAPADYIDRPQSSPTAVDVRLLNDIADEETELLDEDLLALIAKGQH